MRQTIRRPTSVILFKFAIVLCLVFLLQPIAGCANEQPGTVPTVRIDSTATAAGSVQGGAATAGQSPGSVAAPAASSSQASPGTSAGAESTTATSQTQAETAQTSPATQPTAAATEATQPTASPTTTPTAKPTAKPTPKPSPKPTQAAEASPYYLYCELGSFTIQVYGRDASGNYTVPVRRIRTAIGRGSMTPRGKFKLGSRERWHTFGSASYAQYAIKYHSSGLYLHSPLYSSKNIRKLQSWSYNAIGTKNTSGCLRMPTGDIYWIYRNCPAGTVLEIVSGSPRGLTPPALPALKRSSEDPTDPMLG